MLRNSPKVFTADFISVCTLSGGREEKKKSEEKLSLWGQGVIRRWICLKEDKISSVEGCRHKELSE